MLLTSPLSSPLKNPVRDVFSPAGGSPSLTAQVQALFAGGKVGGMWDMGDIATLFQDAATPVTAVTQPIGIVLDKSQGLVRGVELISNGSFDTDTIWSKGTGWSITGGAATSVGANQFQALTQTTATISGKTYEVSFVVSRTSGSLLFRLGSGANKADISASGSYRYVVQADGGSIAFLSNATGFEFVGTIDNVSVRELPGNHATQPTAGSRPLYQVVSSYGCAQFDATDDALLFPAITFGGAFNTFVAGKVTSGTQGIHLWRTADVNGTWAKYKSGDATTPTGTGSGSPTYAVNGTALSPSQQGQLYTQINGVDCVVESIGVVLTAETALQFSGFAGSLFTGNEHRILMISGTLTAAEKLLCHQWCAEGNGVTVV